jgi:hypothetical protein
MNYLKYCVYILLLISFTSCDSDRFSSTKVIEFPEHVSKLAVTSHLSAPGFDSSTVQLPTVFVGNSLGIVEEKEYSIFPDASVRLYKDGDLLYDFAYDENDNFYIGPENPLLTLGTYRLDVSSDGYDPLSTTQVMPSKANITGVTYEFDKVPYDFGDDLYDLMKVKINDPADEENFYAYDVFFEVESGFNGEIYTYETYSTSDDPVVEYGYNIGEVIPDITFNGNSYDLRLLQQSEWSVGIEDELIAVKIIIYTLTKDYYIYETTRSLNSDAQGNPFAEPVLVHSNFENGFGVFTLKNSVEYRYEF